MLIRYCQRIGRRSIEWCQARWYNGRYATASTTARHHVYHHHEHFPAGSCRGWAGRASHSACCKAVRVSGAADVQPLRMGTYQMVPGLTKQGRPVYRSSNGQHLYYWPAFQAWRMGHDHNSVAAGVGSIGREATQCPNEPKVWVAVGLSGECVSRPITVVCVTEGVVRMACAQGGM